MAYVVFTVFIVVALLIDLLANRKSHEISIKQALGWTAFWIALAMVFNGYIYVVRGPEAATLFATAYLVEKALSVDNLFVFASIFAALKTPGAVQHRVLYYGILSAFVMRAVFIIGGVTAVHSLAPWLMAPMGLFLVYLGIQTARKDDDDSPSAERAQRILGKFLPILDHYKGDSFVTRVSGKLFATRLMLVLVFIEITDLVFAMDSVPAVIAITPDAYIAYTSNIFAILGLRSIYFALAALMKLFTYLKYGLSVILAGVGIKMILGSLNIYEVPVVLTLGGIVVVLGVSIVTSLLNQKPSPATKAI